MPLCLNNRFFTIPVLASHPQRLTLAPASSGLFGRHHDFTSQTSLFQ